MAYELLKTGGYSPDYHLFNPRFYKDEEGFYCMHLLNNRHVRLSKDPLKAIQLSFIEGYELKQQELRKVLDL